MILVYPMLTGQNVAPNAIPGITKALEKFILIYGTDEILRAANAQLGKILSLSTKGLTIGPRRSLQLAEREEIDGRYLIEVDPTANISAKLTGAAASMMQGGKVNYPKEKGKDKKGETRLDFPKHDNISLEPTWVKIDTARSGAQLLGVKVIPFPVKGSENLVSMIKSDKDRSALQRKMVGMQRTLVRIIWRLARYLRIPDIKDRAITGDPKKDILFASTVYKNRVFVCFDQMSLEEEDLFSKPAVVQKLFKMGWNSFIIVDDVNKQAKFCMKEFKGMCTVVPTPMLYAAVNKEYMKVYDDLEDVKRSASPFFRQKMPIKRIVGESIATQKMNLYSIREELDLLTEDLQTKAKSIKPDRIAKQVKGLSKAQDAEDIKTILKDIPPISLNKLDGIAKRLTKGNYEKDKKFARKVIENSTNLSSNVADKVSRILAFGSNMKEDGDIKEDVVEYVKTVRKSNYNKKRTAIDDAKAFAQALIAVFAALATLFGITSITLMPSKWTVGRIILSFSQWMTAIGNWKYVLIVIFALIVLIWLSRDA